MIGDAGTAGCVLSGKSFKGSAPNYLANFLPNTRGILIDKIATLVFQKMQISLQIPFCLTVRTNGMNSIQLLKIYNQFLYSKTALLKFIRPTAAHVFDVTDYFGLKLLTRLRLGLSHLNEHKFRHNFRDTINPLCTCSLEPETAIHFLLHCPYHNIHRKTLFESFSAIDETISDLSDPNFVTLLLYGNIRLYSNEQNTYILNSTISFIKSSERFYNALF